MFELPPLAWPGGDGVIDMELLSIIRRWHHRDHFSIREISRRTGLSRNTVRKYLRSDSVEPKFSVPDRPSHLDSYADSLSHMLRQEAGKSRSRSARSSGFGKAQPDRVGARDRIRRKAVPIRGRSPQALKPARFVIADRHDAARIMLALHLFHFAGMRVCKVTAAIRKMGLRPVRQPRAYSEITLEPQYAGVAESCRPLSSYV